MIAGPSSELEKFVLYLKATVCCKATGNMSSTLIHFFVDEGGISTELLAAIPTGKVRNALTSHGHGIVSNWLLHGTPVVWKNEHQCESPFAAV